VGDAGSDILGLGLIGLAAFGYPLLCFIVASEFYTVVEIACCTWVDGNWDRWMTGGGRRFEPKLEKRRQGRVMRHVVAAITRVSVFW
jgi:hypothetical protein